MESVSIRDTFDDCIEIMRLKAQLKGLKLTREIDNDFPDKIEIDKNRLK